ncbi:MAG: hypothetical protein GTN49_10650 [candidate division Zixibacteria bacterium]|nr:hypothetical protein [candidate division Zixibacteria bacterium]
MKVVSLFVSALVGAAAPAGAYLGQIVASFNSPAYNPSALAASGDSVYLYCYGRYMPPWFHVFRLDSTTGRNLGSFQSPFLDDTTGLGYEYGGYLWISRRTPPYVARCDASSGSIYSSFPVTQHSLGGGIACQGDPTRPGTLAAIISCGSSPYLSTRHTTAGSLLSSFALPKYFRDPAWDYRNGVIWFPASRPSAVYAYTTAGSLVTSFPINCYSPAGAAYANNYLYVSNTGNPPYIVYKIHCPRIWQREAPTSVGRVKALFR